MAYAEQSGARVGVRGESYVTARLFAAPFFQPDLQIIPGDKQTLCYFPRPASQPRREAEVILNLSQILQSG